MVEQRIIRLREGESIPEGWIFNRLLGESIEPFGTGTASRHVYTVQVNRFRDDFRTSRPKEQANADG